MPIYGYECNKCGEKFEKLVRSTEPAPACPACESADLTKQLSLIASPNKSGSEAAPPCEMGRPCDSCPAFN